MSKGEFLEPVGKKMTFLVRVRSSGVKSLIITIPKIVVDVLDLKGKELVEIELQRIKET